MAIYNKNQATISQNPTGTGDFCWLSEDNDMLSREHIICQQINESWLSVIGTLI